MGLLSNGASSLLPLIAVLVAAAAPTYTRAQEPSIIIPPFVNDTNKRARQNVCNRFKAYDRGEVPLRQALEGLALRPLFTDESFFHLDETGKLDETYPGMIPKIMDEVARRAGFTWRDSYGLTTGPPKGSNKTWTDLLLWGTDYFDVYADWYARTIDRLHMGVTFPEGFYDSSYLLVAIDEQPEEASINLWQWLEPFDTSVWYCIIATIIFSGVLYQLLDHIPPNHVSKFKTPTFNQYRRQKRRESDASLSTRDFHQRRRSSLIDKEDVYEGAHTIGDGIFLSSLLFTQHFQFMPRTSASRVFSASMGLWALLISSNYTANLASFFVIENTPAIAVSSIEDAIQSGQYICVWGGTAPHDFMVKEHPKAKLIEVDSQVALYEGVRNGDCVLGVSGVYSFDKFSSLKETNPDCNIRWVGRILKYVPAGFAVKADSGNLCSSLVSDVINLHLMEMEQDGFLKMAWQTELDRIRDQDCDKQLSQNSGESETQSRSLKEMAGTFVLHAVFGVVAIVVAIVNRVYDKYNQMSDQSRREVFDQIRGKTDDFDMARKETERALEAEEREQIQGKDFDMAPKETGRAWEEREQSTNHDDDGIPYNDRPASPISNSPRLHLDERLEMMEQTFRRRQDELEQTMKDQMNTIVSLLAENKRRASYGETRWT